MVGNGSVLQDRYQLQQQLSQHPTRQTWLALDQSVERPVVIKLLPFNGTIEWRDVELFEREAQALERLSHPRIPGYLDHFSLDGSPHYLVTVQHYIPGQTLKQHLERGHRFTESELIKIATQVLDVLQYLHGLQPPTLHRDIKPSNLIQGDDQQVYLVDFGSVQIQAPQQGQSFTIVGTYGYTPIEQYGGHSVPASDLYALGATLVHLASGASPSELVDRDMCLQFRGKVQVGQTFQAWLERMTAVSYSQRYDSAEAALKALAPPPFPSLTVRGSSAMSSIALPEFADNPEPRVPVVLLLDTSASMSGNRIQQLNQAVAAFQADVLQDDTAALRVEVAIVTFGPVQLAQSFITIDEFMPMPFTAQGRTPLGEAVTYGLDVLEERKTVYREQGVQYYRPWVFLVSDGAPDPDSPWREAAQRIRAQEQEGKILFFAVGVKGASMQVLQEIAPVTRPPVALDGLKFREMFMWLSSSLQRVSRSVVGGQVELPPVTWGRVTT